MVVVTRSAATPAGVVPLIDIMGFVMLFHEPDETFRVTMTNLFECTSVALK